MRVIGTAGHVDHGKSTLIEAITGIHPDRLQEERDRQMTIVLGFAWVILPNGEEIGIVDVPGHRDFIENMLSGIGAIDAVLFVVAADEGIMPQTREHLAILDLLQIDNGVIALTKTDLVEDKDWLDLVESDLKDNLVGTVLESSPIVRVSAKNGAGIPELLQKIEVVLSEKPPRPDYSRPRMSIDRVFTKSGFGTIVTGTLIDGKFQVGDEVMIMPQQLKGRIRGLQTHKREEQMAVPGSRTAVNISGLDVSNLTRGDVVVYPGIFQSTRRLDVQIRMLEDVSQPLRHNTEVKLFVGAAEVIARSRLLGMDLLEPGKDGLLQLELTKPVLAVRGDRFILRRPSPGETIGGGTILDPHPIGRHKRYDKRVISRLNSLQNGTPEEILFQAILASGVAFKSEVIARSNLDPSKAEQAFDNLITSNNILILDEKVENNNPLVSSDQYWQSLTENAQQELYNYNNSYPLRMGIPREELKSRLKISTRVFNAVVKKWLSERLFEEMLTRHNLPGVSPVPVVRSYGYQVVFSNADQELVDRLTGRFCENPFSPPSIKDSVKDVGEEIFNAMIDMELLIPISAEVVFRVEDYRLLVNKILSMLEKHGTVTVAQVRDSLQTSRRYVLALLEHLDSIGMTIRSGDVRKLK